MTGEKGIDEQSIVLEQRKLCLSHEKSFVAHCNMYLYIGLCLEQMPVGERHDLCQEWDITHWNVLNTRMHDVFLSL